VDWNAGLDTVQDSGGRRQAKYLYPYQDSQQTDDLGRTPGTYVFKTVFFGDNYLNGYDALIEVLNDPKSRNLIHPVFGHINAVMESFQVEHRSDMRKALSMTLTMIETNQFDLIVSPTNLSTVSKLKNFLTKATQVSQDIAALQATIQGVTNFASATLNQLKSLVTAFSKSYPLADSR